MREGRRLAVAAVEQGSPLYLDRRTGGGLLGKLISWAAAAARIDAFKLEPYTTARQGGAAVRKMWTSVAAREGACSSAAVRAVLGASGGVQ